MRLFTANCFYLNNFFLTKIQLVTICDIVSLHVKNYNLLYVIKLKIVFNNQIQVFHLHVIPIILYIIHIYIQGDFLSHKTLYLKSIGFFFKFLFLYNYIKF